MARGLPSLSALQEAYKANSDTFQILAFHDTSKKNFAELDPELQRLKDNFWFGRDLPFPILLDASGKTIKDYGVEHFPTSILIDPKGNVVGEDPSGNVFKSKLPVLPMKLRAEMWLESMHALGLETLDVKGFVETLPWLTVPVKVDPAVPAEALTAIIPLHYMGALTMQSHMNLALRSVGLTIVATDDGLLIRPGQPTAEGHVQKFTRERAQRRLAAKGSLTFKGALRNLLPMLEGALNETVLIDPRTLLDRKVDREQEVTIEIRDEVWAAALDRELGKYGMGYELRDESLILTLK